MISPWLICFFRFQYEAKSNYHRNDSERTSGDHQCRRANDNYKNYRSSRFGADFNKPYHTRNYHVAHLFSHQDNFRCEKTFDSHQLSDKAPRQMRRNFSKQDKRPFI